MEHIRKNSIDSAEHYVWGNGCDGWHFVNHPGLSIIRERMPPGTSEVRHLHKKARQFFYILAGTAVLEIGGPSHELLSGEGIEIPPGVPHQIFNKSNEVLEFLVVSHPHSHGDKALA